ncbi:MAG: large repetitive protein [Acidimicrobiaceae bacterium]
MLKQSHRRGLGGGLVVLMGLAGLLGLLVSSPAVAASTTACPTPPPSHFSDVDPTSVHARNIDCAAELGIAHGTSATTFDPSGHARRDQVASFFARLIEAAGGTLPANPPDAFDDDNGDVHELAINQLAALGIIHGTGPRTFNPGGDVTRGQVASFVVATYAYLLGSPLPAGPDAFSDDNGDVHEADINAAAAAGLANGFGDGTFGPNLPVRRDQLASFAIRALDKVFEDESGAGGTNQAPALASIEGSSLSYQTGSGPATVTAAITVSDPDTANLASGSARISSGYVSGSDTLSFVPVGGITGSFDAATGTFAFTGSGSVADFQAALRSVKFQTTLPTPSGSRTVSFQVDDGQIDNHASNTVSRTIAVTHTNQAPTANAQSVNLSEDIPTAVTLTGNDPDGDSLTFSVTTAPLHGTITAGTAAARTYTPDANYNGSDSFAFTASDGSLTSPPATVSVTVAALNDAPSFTAGPNQTVLEDSGLHTTAAWATAISPGPADEAAQTVNFVVSNDNTALFSAQPAVDATGQLTFTPAANGFGTATVSVSAHDNGGVANGGADTSAPQTVTVTVTGVNDVPSFTKGPDQSVNEDSGLNTANLWATTVSAGPNESAQTLSFIVSNNNNALFSTQPAVNGTGTLTFTPAANANGTAIVTVQIHDDGGTAIGGSDTSASQTFNINVAAVNDAPSFTVGPNQTVLEDVAAQTVNPWATAISPGPADESGQTVNFIVSNSNNALFSAQPTVAANGVLTYTPAANRFGSATVTIAIHDNGGTANGAVDTSASQTFTITITGVNDVPSFTTGPDQSVAQDSGAHSVNPWATAIDPGPNEGSQTVTLPVTNVTNGGLFSTPPAVASDGTLTYTLAAGQFGTSVVTLHAHDDGGTANSGIDNSADQTFNITVVPPDFPPVVTTTGGNTAYTEGAAAAPVDGGVTVTDSDTANMVSGQVRISSGFQAGDLLTAPSPQNGITLTYDSLTGILSASGSAPFADYETALRSVTFATGTNLNPSTPKIVEFKVNDGIVDSNLATKNIAITLTNNPPVVTTTVGTTGFTEDGGPVVIDSGVTVTDPDSAQLQSATVSITASFLTSQDVLAVTNTGTITGVYAPLTGILTLSGNDTVANYQTILQSVTYDNTSQNPSTLARTLSFKVTDAGGAASNIATRAVSVAAVNDAPVLASIEGGALAYDTATTAAVTSTLTTSDADSLNLTGATVAIALNYNSPTDPPLGQDTLLFTNQSGITGTFDTATGILTLAGSSSVANYQTALRSVQYNASAPTPSGTRRIDFQADDGAGLNHASNVQSRDITVTHVNQAPVPAAQSHNVLTNVRIQVPSGSGVKTGATDPEGNGIFVTPVVAGTSTQSGNVDIAADGSYSYDPPAGYVGADSFAFQLCDNGGPLVACANGTVDLTVAGDATGNAIWYVKAGAATSGDGRLDKPFNCLTGAGCLSAVNDGGPGHPKNGDVAFMYSGAYTGGLTLRANQRLIGQGASATVATIDAVTPPTDSDSLPGTGAAPTVTSTGGTTPGVQIASGLTSNATLRGFNIAATAGFKILSGANFGTLTVSEVALNGGGGAFNLTSGALAATFTSVASTSSGTQGLNLGGITGSLTTGGTTISGSTGQCVLIGTSTATMDFGNTSCTGGTDGVSFQNNSAGLKTFGTLTVSGNSATGVLHSTGGGPVTVSGATVITPGGTGIDIQNANANVTFAGVTVNKGASAGTGVNLGSNATRTISFGALSINTSNGSGLIASGGGTVGFTSGAIGAAGGSAINANGITFAASTALSGAGATGGTTPGITLTNVTGPLAIGAGAPIGGNASSNAFVVSGGTPTVSYAGGITENFNNHRAVDIQNMTGGSVTISGPLTAAPPGPTTGEGVFLNSNTGATITLSGGMNILTGAATAFNATGGGTVTAMFPGGNPSVLNTSTGTTINVANTTIGAAGLHFQSVTSNGAPSGIVLNNTGASGGLTVSGDGTNDASGGTIQSATNGVSLTATRDVSLTSMKIQNTSHYGISGTGVVNFGFINGTIDNSGTGLTAQDSNIGFNLPASGASNISGTLTVTGSTLTNSFYHGITVRQDSGTISNLNISSNTFTSSTVAASSNGSAVDIDPTGSASGAANLTKGTISSNTITNFPSGAGIQVLGGNVSSAGAPLVSIGTPNDSVNKLTISGNAIAGQSLANGLGTNAIAVQLGGHSQGNIEILSNGTVAVPLKFFKGNGVLFGCTGESTCTGKINNNVMDASSNIAQSPGISVGTDNTFATSDSPDFTLEIIGNNVSQTDGNGILATARSATGTARYKIQNNTIGAPRSGLRPGIRVDAGNAASVDDAVCLDISGNTSAGNGGTNGIGLRKQGTVATTNDFGIVGLPGGSTATPDVETYVNGQNPAGSGTLLISATSGFSSCGAF